MKPNKQVAAATMKDVALKAKVSTATVSRALMNPDKVSQSTRNKVEQAALEVGYLPQSMGRNVKRNESRTILVIVPDICDPFFSEVIRGIEVTAAEQGYLVLIGDCAHQNQQEKTFLNLIITKQIDGMVLLSSRLPAWKSNATCHRWLCPTSSRQSWNCPPCTLITSPPPSTR